MKKGYRKFFVLFVARLFRIVRRTANVVLILALVIQAALLTALVTGVSLPVGSRAEQFVKDAFLSEGVRLDFERLSFDFKGRVTLHSPKLRFLGTSSDFFEARMLSVRVDPASLVLGEFKLLGTEVHEARISPSYGVGTEGWSAEHVTLRLVSEGRDYEIKNAFAQSGKVYLSLGGRICREAFEDGGKIFSESINLPPDGSEESKTLFQKWDKFCEVISLAREYLNDFTEPAIIANFNLNAADGLTASATLFADALSYKKDDSHILISRDARMHVGYAGRVSKDEVRISFQARSPVFRGGLSAEHVGFRARLNFNEQTLLDARATAIGMNYQGVSIQVVSVEKARLSADDYLGDASMYLLMDNGTLKADLHTDDEVNVSASFEGVLSAAELLKCNLIPKIEELEMFEFREGIHVSGRADINVEAPADMKVSARISVADANLYGVEAASLWGDVSYDGSNGEFWAYDALVHSKEGWIIGGDVYQNLKTYDYRFLLKGTLRAMAISHFMEPWWEEVFTDTLFEGKFPYADFSVVGQWGNPEQIYVYGLVDADTVVRHGVKFDHVDLNVWVNPERIALLDVNVRNGDRWARAALDWVYFSKQLDNYDENRIYAVSTLNRAELIGAGGPEVANAIEILDFENAPEVSIKLFMPNPEKHPELEDTINLDFYSKGLTRVGKIGLNDFRFRGYIKGDDIWLDNMHFSIAKGAGFGEIYITKKEGMDWFSLKARIGGAKQDEFIGFLSSLGDTPPDGPVGLSEFDKFGIVDGIVELAGFIDNPSSLEGRGFASVKNEKLAELNLLGMISRAASSIGFPIASFDLKQATSPFSLSGGIVDFSDIVIEGPTARITARARYDFMNDQLNASGIMEPFAAMDASLVSAVIQIVNPFMSVLEVGMRGPIGNPETSVSIKPLNFFRSGETINRNIERRLDKDEAKQRAINEMNSQNGSGAGAN